jgi:tetratricopeptide (TPR) repeat protein
MRKTMIPAVILAALTAVPILAAGPPGDYAGRRDRAVEAYLAGNHERAIELFEAILEDTPSNPDILYALSRSCEKAGRMDQAIAAGERVLKLGSVQRPLMAYRLAGLHAQSGNTDQAVEWLEQALLDRYEDRPGIAADDSLASLREDVRFRSLAGVLPSVEISRDDGWRFDLGYLVEEAKRMHASPERPAFSREFESQVRTLHEAIPRLSDDQVLSRMTRLLAFLNDGHTGIYGPGPDTTLVFNRASLPYKFYLFPEGLYIVEGAGEWASHAGHRIVRFGDLDAATVLQRMSRYRGVDNPMTWTWMGPQFYVGRLAMLKAVGATNVDESVEATLEAPDGRRFTETVPGGSHQFRRKLRPYGNAEPPLYLSQVDTNFWMKLMPESGALYFQFNQVRNNDDETIEAFAKRLHAALSADTVTTLIVDVRHNNGGNNSLADPLIRTIVAFDVADPNHRIVVLTGRNTFSAAQNFINRLERWTDAEFAGEPSASSPNFVGEETNLLLPFSRVRGSISTRYWQDSDPGDERAWIDMDIPVELSAKDYFAGRDPLLDALLSKEE